MVPAWNSFCLSVKCFGRKSLRSTACYVAPLIPCLMYCVYLGGFLAMFVIEKMGVTGSLPPPYGYFVPDVIAAAIIGLVTGWCVGPVLPVVEKYEAVTLPENQEIELGDIEHLLPQSNGTIVMNFQQSYIAMSLDNLDDPYSNQNPGDYTNQDHHQADAANITSLCENYDSHRTGAYTFNRFKRFDIGGDEETQLNFTPPEHTEIPNSLMPSPPLPEEPLKHGASE